MKLLLAMKPIESYVQNVVNHSQAGLNIDETRIEAHNRPYRHSVYIGFSTCGHSDGKPKGNRAIGTTNLGRWPSNVIHDGTLKAHFPKTESGKVKEGYMKNSSKTMTKGGYRGAFMDKPLTGYGDKGTASRFFKEISSDRQDNQIEPDGQTYTHQNRPL